MGRHLEPISLDENVPKLMKILKTLWPKTLVACTILDKALRWKSRFPETQPLLLVPGGHCEKGTFVLREPEIANNIFLHSLEDDVSEVKELLLTCEYIDWTQPITFGPIASKFHAMLEEIFQEKKLSRSKEQSDLDTQAFWLPVEEALKLHVPDLEQGRLGPLKGEYAELVNSTWPHRYPGSLEIIRYMLMGDPGVGVFVKDTEEPVCWFLRDELGEPGLLYTQPEQRGKGYAKAVAIYMIHFMAEEGFATNVFITKTNQASKALFTKLGFQPHDFYTWFFVQSG